MQFLRLLIVVGLMIYETKTALSPQELMRSLYSIKSDEVQDSLNLSLDNYDDSDEEAEDGGLVQDSSIIDMRNKKSQTLCKVKRIQKTHNEVGYEFHPRQYSEYECVPYEGDVSSGYNHNLGVCAVHHAKCLSIQKYQYYMKARKGTDCWTLERIVANAGCKCIPPTVTQ